MSELQSATADDAGGHRQSGDELPSLTDSRSLLEAILVAIAAAALWRRMAEPDARRWVVIGAVTLLVIALGYVLGPPPATILQMAVAAKAVTS